MFRSLLRTKYLLTIVFLFVGISSVKIFRSEVGACLFKECNLPPEAIFSFLVKDPVPSVKGTV